MSTLSDCTNADRMQLIEAQIPERAWVRCVRFEDFYEGEKDPSKQVIGCVDRVFLQTVTDDELKKRVIGAKAKNENLTSQELALYSLLFEGKGVSDPDRVKQACNACRDEYAGVTNPHTAELRLVLNYRFREDESSTKALQSRTITVEYLQRDECDRGYADPNAVVTICSLEFSYTALKV